MSRFCRLLLWSFSQGVHHNISAQFPKINQQLLVSAIPTNFSKGQNAIYVLLVLFIFTLIVILSFVVREILSYFHKTLKKILTHLVSGEFCFFSDVVKSPEPRSHPLTSCCSSCSPYVGKNVDCL